VAGRAKLYRRGPLWWCWFYDHQGRRICRSTHQSDRALALQVARRLEREHVAAPARSTPLDELIAAYLAHCERKGRAGSTLDFYLAKSEPLLRAFDPENKQAGKRRARNGGRGDYLVAWCYLGVRESELYAITADDVHLDDGDGGMLHVRGTKTAGSDRWIPIAPEARDVLLARVGRRGPLFPPWPNVRRDLASACVRGGIARVSCNDLRRTFATWLAEAAVPEAVTASLLGHASSQMVRRVYTRIGREAQRRAVAMLPRLTKVTVAAGVANETKSGGLGGQDGQPDSEVNPEDRVPRTGIEPVTRGFSVPCSTN